jgi:outer membrane receptor protein involved in Fe transport
VRLILLILLLASSAGAQVLTGTVTDSRGEAVSGAELILEHSGVFERTRTAADGAFSLATSTGVLSVSAAGFQPARVRLDQTRNEPLVIVLDPLPVTGNVDVSVTLSETSQTNAAASIAVITAENLAVTAAPAIDDTLRQVAGFQLFRRSSSRTTNPTAQGSNLRGVSGSGSARASVLFDGLSINDAFGGWTYWSRVPQLAVEQIEVLRGGGSSFYGSGALSGAVNLVPVRMTDEKAILRFETTAATQTTGSASMLLLARRGPWQADLAGELFKTSGYIPVEEASRGDVDTPAASRHSNLILKLSRRFDKEDWVFVRGNLFGEGRDNGTSLTNNRTYFRQAAAGFSFKDVAARVFAEGQVYDQTFSAVSADRNSESLIRVQRIPSSVFGGNVVYRKRFVRHSVAGSAELLNVRGFSDEVGFFNGSANSVSRAGGEARNLSVFIQDSLVVSRRLLFTVSARFDRHRNFDGISANRTLPAGAVSETRFGTRSDSAFSPRVGAVLEVLSSTSVYGSFSRSFRSPSLNELYRSFRVGNIVTEANASLAPERANTFEAGVNTALFKRGWIMHAAIYTTRVTGPVVSVTIPGIPGLITRRRQNVGATTSRGFEIDTELSPRSNLRFMFGYLFVDAAISDFPTSPDLAGRRLPQVSRHNFTSQAVYRPTDRLTLATQVRAASTQYEDDRNTLRLRPYLTADARASYQFPYFVEVFAAIENVLGSRYDIAVTPVRSVAAPRAIRIGLRLNAFKR